MLKINLFINFYDAKNPSRAKELEYCYEHNIKNNKINKIIFVYNDEDSQYLKQYLDNFSKEEQDKINVVKHTSRPTFKYLFDLTLDFPKDINIIANTDIFFCEDSLKALREWPFKDNQCLALNRWEVTDINNLNTAVKPSVSWSQDSWILKGSFKNVPDCDFNLGVLGCDNAIAYLLDKKYPVINPSLTVKTFHYHLSAVRTYSMKSTIPKPYKMIFPTK